MPTDPIAIATLILSMGGKAAELALQAIQASRDGDDAKALAHLDDAIAHLDAAMPGLRAELMAIKERVSKRIDDKFPAVPAPLKNAE